MFACSSGGLPGPKGMVAEDLPVVCKCYFFLIKYLSNYSNTWSRVTWENLIVMSPIPFNNSTVSVGSRHFIIFLCWLMVPARRNIHTLALDGSWLLPLHCPFQLTTWVLHPILIHLTSNFSRNYPFTLHPVTRWLHPTLLQSQGHHLASSSLHCSACTCCHSLCACMPYSY